MIVCENHAIVEDIYVALPLLISNDISNVIWLAILISVFFLKELTLILQRCAILPNCCVGKMPPKIGVVRMEIPLEQYVC